MSYNIKVGSITNAQRARKILREHGLKAYMVRLSHPLAEDGCGYAVKISTFNMDDAVALLESEGINVIGVEAL